MLQIQSSDLVDLVDIRMMSESIKGQQSHYNHLQAPIYHHVVFPLELFIST